MTIVVLRDSELGLYSSIKGIPFAQGIPQLIHLFLAFLSTLRSPITEHRTSDRYGRTHS